MPTETKVTYSRRGTETVSMDSIWVTTKDKLTKLIIDQIFRTYPLLAYVYSRKNTDLLSEGGEQFIVPLELGDNPNAGWIDNEEGLGMDDYDPLSAAIYKPKNIAANVKWGRNEQRVNRGSSRIHSLINIKKKNTEKTIRRKLSLGVCAGAGGNTKEMDGIQRLIQAATPANQTLVVGNVDPTSIAEWRTFGRSMTSVVAGSKLEEYMLVEYNKIEDEVGAPSVIWTDRTTQEIYENNQRDFLTSNGKVKIGDFTFELCQFKEMPILRDKDLPSGEMRFIHSEYLYFCVDSMFDFFWTPWKEQVNVPVTKHQQILTVCNLARSAGRCFSCLFNISETGA